MHKLLSGLLIAFALSLATGVFSEYTPDWDSLDKRPLPSWFDDSKFGIFIHWGLFSVPSWGTTGGAAGEWYWWRLDGEKNPDYVKFHEETYGKDFKYADFAHQFKAELWDPDHWAETFAKAGAKYVVLTSKHHEGWTNWQSKASWNWNSVDAGPHRDLVGDLSAAVKRQNMTMGLYHSLFEWFHPLYLADKANGFNTTDYVDQVLQVQLREIVEKYQPSVIWADGDWEASDHYWKSKEFLAWLYNDSPVKDSVVVNDRWGSGDSLKHGGYYSGGDRYHPGHVLTHKWENCMTIDSTTWGFKRNSYLNEYLRPEELIAELVQTVAFGGNMLLNVGPTHDGRLIPIFEERLLQIGSWMDVNGEAIYGTQPWQHMQNDTQASAYFTTKGSTIYAIVLQWPDSDTVMFSDIPSTLSEGMEVTMLGVVTKPLATSVEGSQVTITLPVLRPSEIPNPFGFVLKLQSTQHKFPYLRQVFAGSEE